MLKLFSFIFGERERGKVVTDQQQNHISNRKDQDINVLLTTL